MSLTRRLYSGNPGFDLRPIWSKAVTVSVVLVVVCLGSLFFRGLNLGIDFEGGGVWEVESDELTVEAVRDALRPSGNDSARIQVLTSGSGVRTIRVQGGTDAYEMSDVIVEALADAAEVPIADVSINTVGPSWGNQITSQAQRALVFFFIAIAAYISIRLEWRMAVGALVAVLHDILISVGVYSIFQFQVTPATVIAFLTILGYSLYDTIVVFDKLRELTPRASVAQGLTYTDMANHATNEVLMRSINTSVTSLLPVLSMLVVGSWIMGATTLEEFAIALAVGLVVGAYSSLFIAVPVVIAMKEREPRFAEIRQRLADPARRTPSPTKAEAQIEAAPTASTPASAGQPKGGRGVTITPAGSHPPRPRKKGKRR